MFPKKSIDPYDKPRFIREKNLVTTSDYYLKPIFHCNTKPLALGHRVGLDPQRNDFTLPIPTCWYRKSLTDPTKKPMDPTRVNGI